VSELHKFLFEGLPVRGMVVRLTDAWVDILQRHAAGREQGAYPTAVRELLGEMTAAAVLMQANIKFNGALVLQIAGDGPVKLAVVEVQPDLAVRATAKVVGPVADGDTLTQLVNVHNRGQCAITLDPLTKFPGQQPYQGVVPLYGDQAEPLSRVSEVLQHYMLQSEQLDTTLVLAANEHLAAGLLIQRLPIEGEGNLQGSFVSQANEDEIGRNEDYQRIALLASSLKREELLSLDVATILRRLFWEESLRLFEPLQGEQAPRFACRCSRERVAGMIRSLGLAEASDILAEMGQIDVGCDFCSQHYRFDAVDVPQIFRSSGDQPPASGSIQ
jgi:molecular chaperone Hsp33